MRSCHEKGGKRIKRSSQKEADNRITTRGGWASHRLGSTTGFQRPVSLCARIIAHWRTGKACWGIGLVAQQITGKAGQSGHWQMPKGVDGGVNPLLSGDQAN
jgi:hypothetical protein